MGEAEKIGTVAKILTITRSRGAVLHSMRSNGTLRPYRERGRVRVLLKLITPSYGVPGNLPHQMERGGKDRRTEFQFLKLTISRYCCLNNPHRLIKLVGYGTMASQPHGIPVDAASFHAIMRDRVEKIILFSCR